MPKNGLNVALKGLDDLFSSEKPGRKNSGNRYSRFPSANYFRSRITHSKFWTMMP